MKQPWYNSLRIQILLLLTLALFPLGSVAIYQTNEVAMEAERDAERALLALTDKAARTEEMIIRKAIGAARFLGAMAPDFIENPAQCEPVLSGFVENDPDYSFIGILPLSGQMICSSAGQPFDFSDYVDFEKTMAAQTPTIVVNTDAPLSGMSVFIISEPFMIDGQFAGFISISVPHRGLPDMSQELLDLGLEALISFNQDGEILTARTDIQSVLDEIPADLLLGDIAPGDGIAFSGPNVQGDQRVYTIVPIQGSPATVMGVWRSDRAADGTIFGFAQPAIFPALMWLASMAVAMMAVYTLVLRHLSRLRRNMDEFALNRNAELATYDRRMPNELQALYDNFDRMTDDIIREEAGLEDALREKNVLIKEVHHRVKNNLQLISSIMNMQIRAAQQDETKTVLSRLQDRVLSLATIHRDLYQSQHAGRVDVGGLLAEIVEKSVEIADNDDRPAKITTDIDSILLFPDQAVPLSLMMAEGVTNAMKYMGAPDDEKPWVDVSLKKRGPDGVLRLANSVGAAVDTDSTGLGGHLMNAFAIQLGGTIEIDSQPDCYVMKMRFTIEEFSNEARDF